MKFSIQLQLCTFILFIILCLFSLSTFANVYQQVDEHGTTVYSDTPLSNQAKKVELPGAQNYESPPSITTPPPKTTTATTTVSIAEEARKPYTTFLIISPKDQETIQNQPIIYVEVQLDPKLQAGDVIQLFLDGKPFGSPSNSTHLQMSLVDRGTHQLSAVIVDANQKIVKESNSITMYVQRIGTNFPARVTPPA